MNVDEFDKIWRLLYSLWPSAAAKKSKVDVAVWRKALEGYDMKAVADSVMEYAQNNKFFPDLADITKHLRRGNSDAEAAIINNAKVLAKIKGIKAPEFQSGADAMAWFYDLETTV